MSDNRVYVTQSGAAVELKWCDEAAARRRCDLNRMTKQLRLHLHRGIGYLAAPQSIRSISDLIKLATDENALEA